MMKNPPGYSDRFPKCKPFGRCINTILLFFLFILLLPCSIVHCEEEKHNSDGSSEGRNTSLESPNSPAPKLHQARSFESRSKSTTTLKPRRPKQHVQRVTNERRNTSDDSLSIDCYAKRSEILRLQTNNNSSRDLSKSWGGNFPVPTSYQRLKPNSNESHTTQSLAMDLGSDLNGHVPQCNKNGQYEPVQCHKVGYCWCVNKYGQPIKNSATHSGQKPQCASLFEVPVDGHQVIMTVTEENVKNFLPERTTPSPDGNSGSDSSNLDALGSGGIQNDRNNPDRRSGTSQEPVLSLITNDCSSSRDSAKERASKYPVDWDVWIPECDSKEKRFYAIKQCHRLKICWCVDQNTGLPLRFPGLLSKDQNINCTEIRRIIDLTTVSTEQNQEQQQQKPTYVGFNTQCDAEMRHDFVSSLMGQYQARITSQLKANNSSILIGGVTMKNPTKLTEDQIFKWAFSTIDIDSSGILDDREWSRFKSNFKLVDRLDYHYHHFYKIDWSMIPLNILRSQRRCWRAFMEFCSNGQLLGGEVSMSLEKWLSCTELPHQTAGIRAYSKEAALKRSQSKNPMLNFKPE